MGGILNDVRFAIRLLLRHPLVTATATVSMALGIGLNSVLFMYLDAYFYRPLPVPDAERVVALSAASADVRDRSLSYPNYRDLRERLQAFDGVVAHRRVSYSFARSRDHAREMRVGMLVSDNFFTALGVTPAAGRLFADAEARPGQDAVVVLSYDFWRSTLGGDPRPRRRRGLDQRPAANRRRCRRGDVYRYGRDRPSRLLRAGAARRTAGGRR